MNSVQEITAALERLVTATQTQNKVASKNTDAEPNDAKENLRSAFRVKLLELRAENPDFVNTQPDDASGFLFSLLSLLRRLNEVIQEEVDRFEHEKNASDGSTDRIQPDRDPPLSPDVLSIGQQSTISKAYQFVIALAIIPHLSAGVGVPISSRSKHGSVISSLVLKDDEALRRNVSVLLDVIQPSNVRSLFLSKHLGDLLAALMQICFASQTDMSPCTATSLGDSSQLKFKRALNDLIERSYGPLIVREILVLQSAGVRKTPSWLRAACGYYLTNILTSTSSGVKSVVCGMITSDTDDWRKFRMVGGVISTPPRSWSPDKYFKLITPQVLSLLDEEDQVLSRQFSRVVAAIFSSLSDKYPDMVEPLLWKPLSSGLNCNLENFQAEKAVLKLYKVVCCGAEPHSHLLQRCIESLPRVFSVYVKHFDPVIVDDTRLACEELLTTCIRYMDHQSLSSFLHSIIFQQQTDATLPSLTEEALIAEDKRKSAILFVLSNVGDESVVETLFMQLLEELSSLLLVSEELPTLIKKYSVMSLLSELCEKSSKACLKQPRYVIQFVKSSLAHFLSTQEMTSHGNATTPLPDTETISLSLGLLTALLGGAADIQLSDSDVELLRELNNPLNEISLSPLLPDETKQLALNLRVAIVTQGLVWLSSQSPNPSSSSNSTKTNSSTMSSNSSKPHQYKTTVSTKLKQPQETGEKECGKNKTSNSSDFHPHKMGCTVKPVPETVENREKSLQSTAQVASPQSPVLPSAPPPTTPSPSTKSLSAPSSTKPSPATPSPSVPSPKKLSEPPTCISTPAPSRFIKAMQELSDPLIPVKGHSLIEIGKLIKSGDQETLERSDRLLELLVDHLSHSDTYIYLSAVTALAELANRQAAKVLPTLCRQLRSEKLVSETRLKLGEVLVKTTRNLGDVAPAYNDLILPTALIGCKSADELVRASSLANLGELCKLLRYSLGSNLYEVVDCMAGALRDSDQSARRAAAHCIYLTTSGLHSNCFSVLGGRCLTSLYKALKSCVMTESDDIVLHHCAVALETLDSEVKNTLFPSQETLEKKIYVLDAPPSGPFD